MGKKKGKKGKKGKKAAPAVVECPPVLHQYAPMDECPVKACEQVNKDERIDPQPNHYPGYCKQAAVMAIVGTEDGNCDNLCLLLRAGLQTTDRVFFMAPWANFVVIRAQGKDGTLFFVFDGCTCNLNIFRHMDLSCGTAGFLHFPSLDDVAKYFIYSGTFKMPFRKLETIRVSDIVDEYASCQFKASGKCMRMCEP